MLFRSLEQKDIRYTPKAKFHGTSGYDQLFDFVISKSRNQPERVVQAITRPTRETATSFIHAWNDTRPVRAAESRAYAILNDMEQPVSSTVLEAFRNYKIEPIPWSTRGSVEAQLAA